MNEKRKKELVEKILYEQDANTEGVGDLLEKALELGEKEGRKTAIEEIEHWLSKELTMHDLSKGVNYILKQNLEIKLKAEKEKLV